MSGIDFDEVSAFDTPDWSPGFLLWRVSTAWRGSIELELRSIGLTHPQFVILATLGWLTRGGDRVTQAAIGKMAGLDPNTVSQIIKGLEKKGFIIRERSSDGRAKNPILTRQGAAILKEAIPVVESKDNEYFQGLTKAELNSVMKIFQKLIKRD